MILTTTENVGMREIREVLGVVRASTFMTSGVQRGMLGGLISTFRNEAGQQADKLWEGREEALARLTEQAEKLGADAIVGIRFATAMVTQGAAEMMIYGTAVRTF
jgi:uncharacterized protein YbjQ (UPF0145 family)